MEMKQRKVNYIESNIEELKVHIARLEIIIKEDMQNLNNNIQSTNLCDIDLRNWGCTQDFQKIQYGLMQLENEKGQLEALENLFK